jgi:hypothetical protein
MVIQKILSVVLFMGVIFIGSIIPGTALSATYYLSPSGNNSNAGTSTSAPWKTFAKAFSTMSGGDTLYLMDGTYSDSAGTGYISYASSYGGDMPSGSSTSNMTTIRAVNGGSVTVSSGTGGTGSYALFLGRSATKLRYAKIQGIKFIGGGSLYNTNHIYIKNCGFYAARQDGGDVFGIGTNDGSWGNTYNLIEDSWVWGKDRIIASNYIADYNIWRRVVVRGDGCNTANCTGSGNPNVGITVYNSQNVSLQNIILVDRILGGGSIYANFASAQHSPGSSLGPAEWLGCISLKSPDEAWYLEADSANANAIKIENSIAWDSAGEGFNLGISTSGLNVQNCTGGVSRSGSGFRVVDFSSGTLRNLISYDSSLWAFNSNIKPSYTDAYLAGTDLYNQTTPTVGVKVTNPLSDGTPVSIKYIPRIETGSALSGTGYGGGNYGATVLYKYGTDGTFHGDSGYNTITANALWPWPNEDSIKSDFASVTGGARGFATGTSRDGSAQTLTKYIWEYLGSQIPSDIYGPSYSDCDLNEDGATDETDVLCEVDVILGRTCSGRVGTKGDVDGVSGIDVRDLSIVIRAKNGGLCD